jgi:phenylalanyl-tRNA synthetase beta chain
MRIQNPLGEDTSIMRTIALPSMMDILARNYNYHNKSVKLYELAKIYLPVEGEKLPQEPKMLMLGTYGEGANFFTLKGELENIMAGLRMPKAKYEAVKDNPSYHPGRCAAVWSGDTYVGVFGQIHPLVARNYDVDAEFYCAELSFDALFAVRGEDPVYQPLPKFPAVTRDIAVLVDNEITVGALEECILGAAKGLLKEVKLFDIYKGANLPEGKKSVAFNLVLRADDRSLTAQEADDEVKAVLEALEKAFGAALR